MHAGKLTEMPARWKVAIVDDHERSRAALRAAIWTAGGAVAGEAARAGDASALVSRVAADVGIFAVGLPDGDGVQAAASVVAAGCPVLLFTSHTDATLVRSEERRVGKECRSRGAPDQQRKNKI